MCCDVLVTVASGFVSLLVVGGAAGIGQLGRAPWWPQIMETCSNQCNSHGKTVLKVKQTAFVLLVVQGCLPSLGEHFLHFVQQLGTWTCGSQCVPW